MRLPVVLASVAALALWAAEVAPARVPVVLRTQGAELVAVDSGYGRAVFTRRGALLVFVARGSMRLVDLPGGSGPSLTQRCRDRARRVSGTTIEIKGRRINCLVSSGKSGGPWQVILRGKRISASGRIRGSLTLDANERRPLGTYSIGSGPVRRWPLKARTFGLDTR